jgi:RNA polymerase sigma factor (sigma-70 family)
VTKNYYTDTALLEGLALGESAAVSSIYDNYHTLLVKWMLSRGGNEEDAADIFQEAILILFEKSKDPEFCLTCKLSTYLMAICKNIWYKKLEKSNSPVSINKDEDQEDWNLAAAEEDLSWHLEKEQQFEQLEQALIQLGEPCAGLLKAFYIEKSNMQEIASRFDYTNAENAKTQKYKCLNRLKKIFFAATVQYTL